MPSNKYARRKFPDIDKSLHIAVTRLCEEYKRIASNEENLSVQEIKLLTSLSRTLINWRKEPVFKNLKILHETKIKDTRPPEEQLRDILHGLLPDEYEAKLNSEEDEDDSQSRF